MLLPLGIIVAVRLLGLLDELVELGDEPAVELGHLLGLDEIFGIEVDEVIEHELAGVAELEVVLAELLEDLLLSIIFILPPYISFLFKSSKSK